MTEPTAPYIAQAGELVSNPDQLSASDRLNRLFDIEWSYQMVDNPVSATYYGYPGQNHRWPDWTLSAFERRKKDYRVFNQALASIDRSQLASQDALSYDLFEYYLKDEIEGMAFPGELLPVSQMHGPQQNIADLMNIMPLSSPSDLENILARLNTTPEFIDQTIELMNEGLKKGITPPRPIIGDVTDQITNQIVEPPAEAPVLACLQNLPSSIAASLQKETRDQAGDIYSRLVVPAFKKLHAYFVDTYLPGCRESIACRDLPDGEAWYSYLVRSYTTTNMTPDDVFEIGHQEVRRIRAEMDKVISQSGFKGDFAGFTEFLRTDPQFFHTSADDLVREYRDISKRADPELAKLFGRLPALPYGVTPIPSYAEKSQTTAFYQPGSPEAGRAGYYYVNTYDLKSRPRWEMEALTLHEAVPGHHLQIALAQELSGLPEFRKKGWITAYGEGWALYAESLGAEMGFYTTPYSRFGQLTYEMWRAVRLVVDVGMHFKGWNRQQAIDFIMENSGKTEHDVTVEIDRYIVWPGQALAYKIGELKIKELRKFAQDTLGERMSLRKFHDEVLCHGSMPLAVLDNHIRTWVKNHKND